MDRTTTFSVCLFYFFLLFFSEEISFRIFSSGMKWRPVAPAPPITFVASRKLEIKARTVGRLASCFIFYRWPCMPSFTFERFEIDTWTRYACVHCLSMHGWNSMLLTQGESPTETNVWSLFRFWSCRTTFFLSVRVSDGNGNVIHLGQELDHHFEFMFIGFSVIVPPLNNG